MIHRRSVGIGFLRLVVLEVGQSIEHEPRAGAEEGGGGELVSLGESEEGGRGRTSSSLGLRLAVWLSRG